jgi:hypothetical protein
MTVREFTNELHDGVRIVSYAGTTDVGGIAEIWNRSLLFPVVHEGAVRVYSAYCTLLMPASPEDETAVSSFLNSLDFASAP